MKKFLVIAFIIIGVLNMFAATPVKAAFGSCSCIEKSLCDQVGKSGSSCGTKEGFVCCQGNFDDLKGTTSIPSLLATAFSWALPILFITFFFVISIGALKWIGSGGNEDKIVSARKTISNGVIGLAVIVPIFVAAMLITEFFGMGSIFDFKDELNTCNGQTLLQYKIDTDQLEFGSKGCTCACNGSTWICESK